MRAITAKTLLVLMVTTGTAWAAGLASVGMIKPFPKSAESGAKIEFELCEPNDKLPPTERKKLFDLKDGQRIPIDSISEKRIFFRWRTQEKHDWQRCMTRFSDNNFTRIYAEKVTLTPDKDGWYTHQFTTEIWPRAVGRWYLAAEAKRDGKMVALRSVAFEIYDDVVPRNTHYLEGKTDSKGNKITCSAPVELKGLNETPILKDNDYPFQPQQAYRVVNFERFPPFQMPQRFLAVYGTRMMTDCGQFGGPLNRGFNMQTNPLPAQNGRLMLSQLAGFAYPGTLVSVSNDLHAKDPKKYADLKAWVDHRSAFVSSENAYKLGWEICGNGCGLYSWDEEEMGDGTGLVMLKEHPELCPESLRKLKEKDPELKDPKTAEAAAQAFREAWGEFVGQTYRGARAHAASWGRTMKIFPYGLRPLGICFLTPDADPIDPKTGQYSIEDLGVQSFFYKNGEGKIDFAANEFTRQADYFQADFYYQTVMPDKASLYEKESHGEYVLDDKGRRKFREDIFEEKTYAGPFKIGYEDCRATPAFLAWHLVRGELPLFWLNGGKPYTKHGTAITDKQLIPTYRRFVQETYNKTAQLGSRPVSPYLAEATPIFTFLMGIEGLYYWDDNGYSATEAGQGEAHPGDAWGEIEFTVKGMHRVSQFNSLFEGEYYFIRPTCHYNVWDRDQPIIRGIVNGRYLLLAMTNPYLDPGETQPIEIWYGSPDPNKSPNWSGKVKLEARKTHLFQCKLPAPPQGKGYNPENFFFRFTCVDGKYQKPYLLPGDFHLLLPDAKRKFLGPKPPPRWLTVDEKNGAKENGDSKQDEVR